MDNSEIQDHVNIAECMNCTKIKAKGEVEVRVSYSPISLE